MRLPESGGEPAYKDETAAPLEPAAAKLARCLGATAPCYPSPSSSLPVISIIRYFRCVTHPRKKLANQKRKRKKLATPCIPIGRTLAQTVKPTSIHEQASQPSLVSSIAPVALSTSPPSSILAATAGRPAPPFATDYHPPPEIIGCTCMYIMSCTSWIRPCWPVACWRSWPVLCSHHKSHTSPHSAKKVAMAMATTSLPPAAENKKKKNNNNSTVIVISGPTGAGKSRLALEVAKRLGGEIISADSVQVYRGLDIGSAKPSAAEMNLVPHHLIDILDTTDDYSAGSFFRDARRATRDVLGRGRVPVVAGGTGLYLRWYMYGKPDVPQSSMDTTSAVYSELLSFRESGQWEEAVELVARAGDPKALDLSVNNWKRLSRRLEIIRSSGSPPSAFALPYNSFHGQRDAELAVASADGNCEAATELDYDFFCIFLASPRIELYRSIDLRCEEMLVDTGGLLSEASWLLGIGLHPHINSATRAIGYKQAMEYLLQCRQNGGESTPQEFLKFLARFQSTSRNFAKRQLTWFRNETIYQWVDASQPFEPVVQFICNAYHDRDARVVPESLGMKRVSCIHKTQDLKTYRSVNRVFCGDDSCSHILDWIRRTQRK